MFLRTLADRLRSITTVVELLIPFDRGDVLAAVHREGEVVSTTEGPTASGSAPAWPSVGGTTRRVRRPRRSARPRVRRDRRAVRSAALPLRPARTTGSRSPHASTAGSVDLSIGTPMDPPPPAVVEAFSTSNAERGYPNSIGSPALREAVSRLVRSPLRARRAGGAIGACIGSKEFVDDAAAVAAAAHTVARHHPLSRHLLPELRDGRDPRRVPGRAGPARRRLASRPRRHRSRRRRRGRWRCGPTARATRPAPSTTSAPIAAWGRAHAVPVFSDECYVEFTWDGPGRTILEHGTDGVMAMHSLSKRSNLAGARVGFYAGDAELVHYLQEVRKHVGMMVPGPAQHAAVVALDDDAHVDEQRERLPPTARPDGRDPRRLGGIDGAAARRRLLSVDPGRRRVGLHRAAGHRGWRAGESRRVLRAGAAGHVRVAVVQPDERIELVAQRLGV